MARKWIAEHHPNSVSFAREALIYVAQRDRDDAIKIGWTSNLERRLREVRKGQGCPVNLVAAFAGDKTVELKLHARFSATRVEGEWFLSSPEIHRWLADIRSAAA
jgi:predicted GIY-YIG superfamily endonuclease